MINEAIGRPARIGDLDVRDLSADETGHAIYGPYLPVRPGLYQVTFKLALGDGLQSKADDRACVALEVAAAGGAAILSERRLNAAELSKDLRSYTVSFNLNEYRTLEFRVAVLGVTALLVDPTPILERRGDAEPPTTIRPRDFTADPVELNRQIRSVLRRFEPMTAQDHKKIRLGHAGDGGYICIDDFDGIDTALSFGINDDISWDLDAADRGLTVYQFDHTVDDPAPHDPRLIFEKKMIDVTSGDDRRSLSDLIRAHDNGRERPNIILKMDIEAAEWEVLRSTPASLLERIAWIVCEMHYFQGLAECDYRTMIDEALERLSGIFGVIHIHANNGAGISNVANVIFPNVLEATFVNRALYPLTESRELFPGELDVCCDPNQPDLFLGSFRF